MERVGSDGRFDASEVRPISDLRNGLTYFRQGDVIVAKITPCFENGKGACLENLPTALGFGSTEFHVIRPSKAIVSAYFYRVTTFSEFRRLGADEMTGAAGQQRVPVEFIANFSIPIPPLPEQTTIMKYLDTQTAKIDAAIATPAAKSSSCANTVPASSPMWSPARWMCARSRRVCQRSQAKKTPL